MLELRISLFGEGQKPSREHKGKHISQELSNYVAIDIETTGLDPQWDSIIEFAAVKIKDGLIVDQFQSLVQSELNGGIGWFITELTGITDEMLAAAPSLKNILPDFLEFIGDSTLVAHNAHFDINFIYDKSILYLERPFKNDFLDTMRMSRCLFREHDHHRLADLVERFGIADDIEHRALSDAINTYQCYEYMRKCALDKQLEFTSLFYTGSKPAKYINATKDGFDKGTSIYGRLFVFTGKLERMLRKEAMQLVVDMGGLCGDTVTQETNYLVLGNNDYCSAVKDGKSAKQKKAEKLQLAGFDIEVISENIFYEMIAENLKA